MPLAHDWPNGRILIAGPQAVIALDLQRILRGAGYRVVGPVATAAEARRLIDRGPVDGAPVDGAIVDLDLDPSAASAILELLDDAGIPAVFLSGAALQELPERHRDRPLVYRPYTGAGLLTALRRALEKAADETEGQGERQGEGAFLYPISPPPIPWPRVFPQL